MGPIWGSHFVSKWLPPCRKGRITSLWIKSVFDCLTIRIIHETMVVQMTWVFTFANNYSNHPRMCVLSTLCGNVDKHSPFDIHMYIYTYIEYALACKPQIYLKNAPPYATLLSIRSYLYCAYTVHWNEYAHAFCALPCFVIIWYSSILPYGPSLLHWHCGKYWFLQCQFLMYLGNSVAWIQHWLVIWL